MSQRRVRGVKSLQTSLRITTHPSDGITSSLTIEGEAAQVKGQQAAWAVTGAQTNYEESEGFGRLDVTYANGAASGIPEVPVIDWEFDGEDFYRDLFEHPLVTKRLSIADISQVKKDLRDDESPVATGDEVYSIPVQQSLFERYQRGQTTYYVGAPVVRKITTVSSSYQLAVAVLGIGHIWHGSDIITLEGSMFDWLADLVHATDHAYDNKLIEDYDETKAVFGWLKKWPKIRQRWGQKVELSQEWVGALWQLDEFTNLF